MCLHYLGKLQVSDWAIDAMKRMNLNAQFTLKCALQTARLAYVRCGFGFEHKHRCSVISLIQPQIQLILYWNSQIFVAMATRAKECCTNVNIIFRTPDVISFPKMYSFANLHKLWTKVIFGHSEPDYLGNRTVPCKLQQWDRYRVPQNVFLLLLLLSVIHAYLQRLNKIFGNKYVVYVII